MGHTAQSHRRSIRLRAYDYASPGAYFVTTCTRGGQPLFEDPVLKEIIEQTLCLQQERFPHVSIDSFVVMPNHVHFIVWLNPVGAPLAGAHGARPTARAGASPAPTLADVVGAFKSTVATKWLKRLRRHEPHRSGRVWQRNYYERVIRNEDELSRIRDYILHNPSRWEVDQENPQRVPSREHEQEWAWLEGSKRASLSAPGVPS